MGKRQDSYVAKGGCRVQSSGGGRAMQHAASRVGVTRIAMRRQREARPRTGAAQRAHGCARARGGDARALPRPPLLLPGPAASSRGTVLLRLLKRAGARKVGATPPHTPASKDEETASTWPSRLSRDQSRRRPCAPTPSPPLPQASLQDTCSCPQTPCPRPPGVAGVVWLPRQTSLLSQGQLGWALSSSRVEPEQE